MNMSMTAAVAAGLWAAAVARGADPVAITVHTDKTTKTISTGIYGQFLEHIFNSVHGGLWGDQILNGTLELRPTPAGRGTANGAQASVAATAAAGRAPRGWEFMGNEVTNDAENAFNAQSSVRIEHKGGMGAASLVQRHIALKQGEKYTLEMWVRGEGKASVLFVQGQNSVADVPLDVNDKEWVKKTAEVTVPQDVDDAMMDINVQGEGSINVDQVSLFSASALANHKLRPDLYKAVADLKPASIRWPGGSFANNYVWQNGVGPAEKRLPHPVEQWNDRDPNQFGTDEFLQMCERIGAEGVLVINTARGVPDALNWLEYCMGDESTPMGKLRAANGRKEPYAVKTLEIDNEYWLLGPYEKYLALVKEFAPAIKARYPAMKISVCGSYAFDTGPGEGNAAWKNANWDPRIITDAGALVDILSPHYYNGLLPQHPADYKDDPWKYEEFLRGRGDLIARSANPNMKIYLSEWNLTKGPNDWRMGLYAGGILNAMEREGDLVQMSCPALFMRKIGVTNSWDNALINFNEKSWFPAGNYVVMKLWREAFAPNLLAADGGPRPLSYVATRSEDKKTVFLKVVNPESTQTPVTVTLDGEGSPKTATMEVIAPGAEDVKNSIAAPDNIKAVPATATLQGKVVKFTMPAWSAAVVRVSQ